jgi:hypothetical protein
MADRLPPDNRQFAHSLSELTTHDFTISRFCLLTAES